VLRLIMKVENIKAIFTNILFVIGIILMVYGFIQGSLTVVRSMVFDKYPLQSYEERSCEYENNYVDKPEEGKEEAISPEEKMERERVCEEKLDYSRKVVQTEHIVGSLSSFVAGLALIVVFKRFIFN